MVKGMIFFGQFSTSLSDKSIDEKININTLGIFFLSEYMHAYCTSLQLFHFTVHIVSSECVCASLWKCVKESRIWLQ